MAQAVACMINIKIGSAISKNEKTSPKIVFFASTIVYEAISCFIYDFLLIILVFFIVAES